MDKKLKNIFLLGNQLLLSILASGLYTPWVRQLTKYAHLKDKVKNIKKNRT